MHYSVINSKHSSIVREYVGRDQYTRLGRDVSGPSVPVHTIFRLWIGIRVVYSLDEECIPS